jgi:hypothetical protein
MRKDTTYSRLEPGTSNSYSRLSAAARGYLFNYCGKETENLLTEHYNRPRHISIHPSSLSTNTRPPQSVAARIDGTRCVVKSACVVVAIGLNYNL